MTWDFVVPDDEIVDDESLSNRQKTAEYRPNRMALGCSEAMIRNKISENAKKSRLTKLLRRRNCHDDVVDIETATANLLISNNANSDDEISKSQIVKKSKVIQPAATFMMKQLDLKHTELNKNQKKRLKKKQKQIQKSLIVNS